MQEQTLCSKQINIPTTQAQCVLLRDAIHWSAELALGVAVTQCDSLLMVTSKPLNSVVMRSSEGIHFTPGLIVLYPIEGE